MTKSERGPLNAQNIKWGTANFKLTRVSDWSKSRQRGIDAQTGVKGSGCCLCGSLVVRYQVEARHRTNQSVHCTSSRDGVYRPSDVNNEETGRQGHEHNQGRTGWWWYAMPSSRHGQSMGDIVARWWIAGWKDTVLATYGLRRIGVSHDSTSPLDRWIFRMHGRSSGSKTMMRRYFFVVAHPKE